MWGLITMGNKTCSSSVDASMTAPWNPSRIPGYGAVARCQESGSLLLKVQASTSILHIYILYVVRRGTSAWERGFGVNGRDKATDGRMPSSHPRDDQGRQAAGCPRSLAPWQAVALEGESATSGSNCRRSGRAKNIGSVVSQWSTHGRPFRPHGALAHTRNRSWSSRWKWMER